MNTKPPKWNESGFSLIELSIASVILVIVIGIIVGIVSNVQRAYSEQRPRTEAVNDASAAMNMITHLVKGAGNNPQNISGLQPIDPGTPQSGIYRTIRIRSDWRGATMSSFPDGDINDSYEDIEFFVQNNKLMKQEPSDTVPVEFLDNVDSLQFVYFDANNVMIVDPVTNVGSISRIDVTIIMQPPGSTPMIFTTSCFMRQS